MSAKFAATLKELRQAKNMSQQDLADHVFVNRTTVTNWENGRRIPDIIMIRRLAECFEVDVGVLLGSTLEHPEHPEVIVADDERLILMGSMSVLEKALPTAHIAGFTRADELLTYAHSHKVSLAFLDIEMGVPSGLELCRELLAIHAETNVVFLTAYEEYALEAWDSGACGFLRKPLFVEDVKKMLGQLRHPVYGLELNEDISE